jgi:hypothetical protein
LLLAAGAAVIELDDGVLVDVVEVGGGDVEVVVEVVVEVGGGDVEVVVVVGDAAVEVVVEVAAVLVAFLEAAVAMLGPAAIAAATNARRLRLMAVP